VAIAVLASLALVHPSGAQSSPKPVHVLISDYAFKPASMTVQPGTSVTWTNQDDDPHTVTANDGSFDSKGLGQGDSFTQTFAKPGTYPYHCAAHPFMKGTITVSGGTQ
jgi:plastocyanin